jgi:hypothetical protein
MNERDPLRELQEYRYRRAEIALVEAEARLKAAEAQLKETAARRAADELHHAVRRRARLGR